jgi:cytidylate kinase
MMRQPRGIEAIVEDQVRRWEARKKRRARKAMEGHIWPVITVSRQYGSQGAAMAKVLGEETGFECWDRKIVHEIAEHSSAPERLFESLDEHRRSAISDMVDTLMGRSRATASQYLAELTRVVHTLAEHGAAIVVGRGAQFIVNPRRALRVRVVASVKNRARGLMERNSVSESAALSEIERVDADRRDFIRQNYHQDVSDPVHYDLVVNSGTMRLNNIVGVVRSAYQARFGALPAGQITTPPPSLQV